MREAQAGSPIRSWRLALNATLLFCILTTAFGGIACRSGGIKVRSWEEAVVYALTELEAAGDLESRLVGYDQTAARLSTTIELLDRARPALELINKLRDVQVPLVGNGWQILLTLLGMATADGARIIDGLEDTLRSLTELKHSLDYLNGLSATAKAVSAFRGEPNRKTLLALSSTSGSATPSLRRLNENLSEILEPLEDVTRNLGTLVRGLYSAAEADVPVVSDAARQAADRIEQVEEPLLTLQGGLDQLYRDIGYDVQVLENIQEATRQARKHAD